jgi:hypothetical protein
MRGPAESQIKVLALILVTQAKEYGPTEILPPIGPMLPRPARLCRPRRSPPARTPAENRGFST